MGLVDNKTGLLGKLWVFIIGHAIREFYLICLKGDKFPRGGMTLPQVKPGRLPCSASVNKSGIGTIHADYPRVCHTTRNQYAAVSRISYSLKYISAKTHDQLL